MQDAFNCPSTYGKLIKAGREVVGSKGLFITKKRYAIKIYDLEGNKTDKIKNTDVQTKQKVIENIT